MNRELAKSHPEQTIQEHTDALLEQYEVLKAYLGDSIDHDIWALLKIAVLFHDIGKLSPHFQNKIYEKLGYPLLETGSHIAFEIPHNYLSILFVDWKRIKREYSKEQAELLRCAIYLHHARKPLEELVLEKKAFQDYVIECLLPSWENFEYEKLEYVSEDVRTWTGKKGTAKDIVHLLDQVDEEEERRLYKNWVLIKGFLNRLDYAASAEQDIQVEVKPNSFIDKAIFREFSKYCKVSHTPEDMLRPVQTFMRQNQDRNLLVKAPTGAGKTEGALLWIGQDKGFFTLPLRISINAIYERIKKTYRYEDVALLHSGMGSVLLKELAEKLDGSNAEQHKDQTIDFKLNQTRQLGQPLTICTVDQLFTFVFQYNGFEPILSTLSYSKVVIDEIQMYDHRIVAFLIFGLSLIHKMGGKFAVMTATIPKYFETLLQKTIKDDALLIEDFIEDDPKHARRHRLSYQESEIDYDEVCKLGSQYKVLVIANTVKKAQEHFDVIKGLVDSYEGETNVRLLHSNFIRKHRAMLEEDILDFAGKDSPTAPGIWITTQLVEASLDVDFDFLFTEHCAIDSLIQRIGRVIRRRLQAVTEESNVRVFRNENGAGSVIRKDIYESSADALQQWLVQHPDGYFQESDKAEWMNLVYDPDYNPAIEAYQTEIWSLIKQMKSLQVHSINKADAVKQFRDIESLTVIPVDIFEELRQSRVLDEWDSKLNGTMKISRVERLKVYEEITKYTVSIPYGDKQRYMLHSKGVVEELRDYPYLYNRGIYKLCTTYDFDEHETVRSGYGLSKEAIRNDNMI